MRPLRKHRKWSGVPARRHRNHLESCVPCELTKAAGPLVDPREWNAEHRAHRCSDRLSVERISGGWIEQDALHAEGGGDPENPTNVIGISYSLYGDQSSRIRKYLWFDPPRPVAERKASAMKVDTCEGVDDSLSATYTGTSLGARC